MKIWGVSVGSLCPSRHYQYNTLPEPIENSVGFVGFSLGGLLPSSVIPLYHRHKKYEFFGVVGVEKTIGFARLQPLGYG